MKNSSCSLILILCFVLSSCAAKPPRVLRKDVSDSEVAQDNAACRAQAETVQSSDWAYRGTFMEGAMIQQKKNEVFELCLQGKGYR